MITSNAKASAQRILPIKDLVSYYKNGRFPSDIAMVTMLSGAFEQIFGPIDWVTKNWCKK